MAFHEVQFPTSISYGSRGGPGYSTAIISVDSGAEERVSRWSAARRKYDVSYGIKSVDDLASLSEFYIARSGPAHGFRFKDHLDFTSADDHTGAVTDTDQTIETGDATTKQFQLIKTYSSGGTNKVRNIRKPVSGTVVVALDGVNQPTGWTVDTTTGIITFTVAPGAGVVISAGFEFDVPVRFGKEVDEALMVSIEEYDLGGTAVPLVEIINEVEVPDEYNYRGAADLSISASTQLAVSTGVALRINATVGSLKVYLPAAEDLPQGGIFFVITGATGTNDFTLAIDESTDLIIISDGDTVLILLSENNVWYAV